MRNHSPSQLKLGFPLKLGRSGFHFYVLLAFLLRKYSNPKPFLTIHKQKQWESSCPILMNPLDSIP